MPHNAITLTESRTSDFAKILPLLKSFWKSDTPERNAKYRRLFTKLWDDENDVKGLMLLDGDTVVGYLGTLYHTRLVNGISHRFCNLTSWYVLESYRKHSLRLARRALEPKEITFTALTATERAATIWQRLGFEVLEDAERICYPTLSFAGRKCNVQMIHKGIESVLNEKDMQIYRDHKQLPCLHILIECADEYCYLIAHRVPRKPLAFARVFHISNPDMFRRSMGCFRNKLCCCLKVAAIRIEERYLQGQSITFSRRRELTQPRLFRSDMLKPEDVDGLYSELLVL